MPTSCMASPLSVRPTKRAISLASVDALAAGDLAQPVRTGCKAFQPAAQEDPTLARGRYLVEGLGHCGACHTPRSVTMQEKALTNADSNDYLAGSSAPIDGWTASNLRGDNRDGLGRWGEHDLRQFLRYGRNDHTSAFGGMVDVVDHSLQHLTDDDITAIARYLKSLGAKDPHQVAFSVDDATAKALWKGDDSQTGAVAYIDSCAACHKTDGSGYTRFYPRCAATRW